MLEGDNKKIFEAVYRASTEERKDMIEDCKMNRIYSQITQADVANEMKVQQPDVSTIENTNKPTLVQTTKYVIAIKTLLKGKESNEKN